MINPEYLPLIFAALTALAVLVYAILDGYDLGVGILLPMDNLNHRNKMIASIGPFWDANETWLVLAVGLVLIAFPTAHNIILKALYLPATIMLIGLILRGVAFDFRAKAAEGSRLLWDRLFKLGSIIASTSQGYMLGMYVMGFDDSWMAYGFAILSALGVTMAYVMIGAAWLIMKTEGELQANAIQWAKWAGRICFVGIIAVCTVNPFINEYVFERWFNPPWMYLYLMIPFLSFSLVFLHDRVVARLPLENDRGSWLPFLITIVVFICCFSGLALSFYPYIVLGQVTIWEAASAPESLMFILWGAIVVIPCIAAYTFFSYRVFWGKVTDLHYY
ncbi:cytochrome d ubiquinol oxidase subunit II [Aestuariibacter sp. AA17]|uniref:Cytochrome d ubiquinol oxidase subunit II n=1 Tax=Fluctibacter corallii TaxID=2984329 RepID=A0ABT3ACF7_9ALTE|nr:cytochrome d ubiquinol oxidase subunit II [Aestuariibacter sp. AA17]MCV2886314.1 cytochrome d ubiquinol oxidase subunit II [Aestuariibacter sp. AA17]